MAQIKKHFKRENCSNMVRVTIEDQLGNMVTLIGKHAFEWSISRETNGKLVIITFPNREMAKKEFERYKK